MEDPIDSKLYIECLDIPINAYNVLKRAQINTLPELLAYNSVELLKLKHFGPASLSAVTKALAAIDYSVIDSAIHSTQTMKHQLYFVPRVLINRDGTKRVIQADSEVRLQLIHKAVLEIWVKEYLSDHQKEHLQDVLDSLQEVLAHFGDPGDSFGEPPVTLDEMHAAAWQQHKEMHS